jgi:hypothetical protein
MERIRRAFVADCEVLLQWLSSNALVEKEGSLYVTRDSLPLLAQFGIEICTSPAAGRGLLGLQEVPGSNRGRPTKKTQRLTEVRVHPI